ncbi:MAG: MFS transporter [Candidatus Asgardarchaeia archaeon]
MKTQRRSLVVFVQITILYILQNMCSYLIIPNFNLIKLEFSISDTYLGVMSGTYLFFSGIAALIWSYASDTSMLKRKIFLAISLVLSGFFLILSCFSSDFTTLFFWRTLSGLAIGSVLPLGFSIISDAFPRDKRTQMFMLWYILGGFGLGLGFGLAVFLGNFFNWRSPLLYGGLTILLAGGIVSLSILEPERASSEEELLDIIRKGVKYKFRFRPEDIAIIASNKSNIFAALQGIFGTIPNGIIFTWTIQYFVRDLGTTELVASFFLGIMSTGALGGLLISYVADYLYNIRPAMRPIIAGFCSIFESILFILFFLLPLKLNIYSKDVLSAIHLVITTIFLRPLFLFAFLLFFFAMFFNSPVGPIRNSVLSDVNLPEHRATVLASLTILELFSKAAGITMIGILSDFFNSLRFPIIIAMTLWIASGIAWFYLAWYYEYDLNFVRGVLENRKKTLILDS